MRLKSGLVALMGAALVLGAAPDRAGLLAAPPSRLQQAQKAQTPVWGIEGSDLPRDPAFRLGRLANGMRYIIRHNETPKGQVVIRLRFDVGSLDEGDDQRGYAHFVEHMAFEGSTHVPAGEMVRLLERNGLAFGADTNAFTSFETTTYHLDLPRNDAALVETALMLMRETAGELTFDPAAVDRERGVIQAEKRDRDNWSYRETVDRMGFLLPQSRVMQRWPIGTPESLNGATAQGLRAFWAAHYVPSRATLVVVGDIDPVRIEADIARRFGNWPARPAPAHPPAGPFPPDEAPRSAIYTDPALTERVLIARTAPHDDEPDTLANRREELLRAVGYGIINRRLQHLARAENPPLRSASFGTGESFHAVRTTQLAIDALSGQMPRAIQAGVETWRRAMEQGFTPAEVNEQLVNLCAGSATAAVAANTRSNLALAAQALSLVTDQVVPVDPVRMNDWVQAEAATVTPEAVLAALRREALPLDRPLIRFQGRAAPAGGVDTLRAQFAEAMAAPLPALAQEAPQVFAYGNFGAPGRVVADRRDPLLGVRMVRFANGVMLNLKHTDLMKGQALVQMNVDGGGMLATRAAPLAVELVPMMGDAGLGRHSRDDLQTILAGHPVALGLVNRPETFQSTGAVRSEDVRLQLQVMAAYLTDPGYRLEAEREYRSSINTLFARLQAAPEGVMAARIGQVLSDGDPRFSLASPQAMRALTFAGLKTTISDRLAHGAIEIGIAGDIDEDKAIEAVAATLGALPAREADFRPYDEQRSRPFTANRRTLTFTHGGPADKALIRVTWPTRDDFDPQAKQVLNMLDRVLRLQLTDTLREKLGKTYSPQTASEPSRVWKNYGTFSIQASINAGDVDITRAAIAQTVAALRDHAPAEDVMLRARAPLMESFEATFKSNSGWLATIARAQGKPDSIERQLAAPQRLLRVTASEVQAAARLYLADDAAVTVIVLPRQPTPASAPAAPAQPGPGTSAQTAPGTPAATPHAEATPAQPPA